MATISSPGLASGIDVTSIVSQLVALEKVKLQPLQTQASSIQTKLSSFGNIKSQVSALSDAAATLSTASGWNSVNASSSNSTAVSVTASAGAPTTSLSIEVQNLAKAQATASSAIPTGTGVGTGSLTIELGSWGTGSFVGGSATPVSITVEAGKDSLTEIAAQINKAGAGVSAMVLKDANGERLLMRSTATGEENGFRVTAADDDGLNNDASGLSHLAYDPGTASGMGLTQAGENAMATVNNVAISSASNTLSDSLPGLNITLSQVTTSPVELKVTNDDDAVRKNLQTFVTAYNTLQSTLATATRYDATSKVAGALQGDSTAIGLQNALRSMMRSITPGGDFTSLSSVGIEVQAGGGLNINADKLTTALTNRDALQSLFTATSTDTTSQGFGLKVATFADALLDTDGLMTTKTESLQAAFKRNTAEQTKVNDRASRFETRMLAQYNAMDAKVGLLNSLNSFVTQQITLWNNSSN